MTNAEIGNCIAIPHPQEDCYEAGTQVSVCPLCGKEIPEDDWDDGDHFIGDGYVYCHECIKAECDFALYARYIREKEIQEELCDWLSKADILYYLAPVNPTDKMSVAEYNNRRRKLDNLLAEFCFEDADDFCEWWIKNREEN